MSVTNKKLSTGDSIVSDYFNEDHNQIQSNLQRKRTVTAVAGDTSSSPLKRQRLDDDATPAVQPPAADELYDPEEFKHPPPQALLDALEHHHTDNIPSRLITDDNVVQQNNGIPMEWDTSVSQYLTGEDMFQPPPGDDEDQVEDN